MKKFLSIVIILALVLAFAVPAFAAAADPSPVAPSGGGTPGGNAPAGNGGGNAPAGGLSSRLRWYFAPVSALSVPASSSLRNAASRWASGLTPGAHFLSKNGARSLFHRGSLSPPTERVSLSAGQPVRRSPCQTNRM